MKMRHYILLFMCWLLTLGCGAQKPQSVEPNEPVEPFNYEREYTKEDSALVVKLLKDAKKNRKTLESRMLYFGKKFLGLPYVGHTLELGDKEHLIVNLRELDCTTFVETVTALTLCDIQDKRTFDDFCNNLMRIRYRQGKMEDYTSRLHYFTWWGNDNVAMGIVKEISMQGKPFAATQTININYMSKHPDLYKQLKKPSGVCTRHQSLRGRDQRQTISLCPQGKPELASVNTIRRHSRWRHRSHADRQGWTGHTPYCYRFLERRTPAPDACLQPL